MGASRLSASAVIRERSGADSPDLQVAKLAWSLTFCRQTGDLVGRFEVEFALNRQGSPIVQKCLYASGQGAENCFFNRTLASTGEPGLDC